MSAPSLQNTSAANAITKSQIVDLEGIFHQELKAFFAQPERIAEHLKNAEKNLSEKELLLKLMNSASQDFPRHLGVLRERMLHPTNYDQAISYFFEEFAGDQEFVRASDCEKMPHLVSVLGEVVSGAVKEAVKLDGALVSYLREHRFVHGNAQAAGRIVMFFYFEEADTGLVMLIPGVRGDFEIARIKLVGGLINPLRN